MLVNTFKLINFGNSQPLKPLTDFVKDKETWTKPSEPKEPVIEQPKPNPKDASSKINYLA